MSAIQRVRMARLPKNGNRAPIAGGGRGRHNLHRVCGTADSSTTCKLCRLKPIVLDDLPYPINDSEKDLTRKERATLAHLRSGYCKLLGSYKSRIKKDSSLNVCADCGKMPQDVKHLFACPAYPTTLIPSDPYGANQWTQSGKLAISRGKPTLRRTKS